MEEFEYFIFIPVKRFIACIARISRYLLASSLVAGLLAIALYIIGFLPLGIFSAVLSDLMYDVLFILLSILTPWCHNVLVAGRGHHLTRFLSGFTTIMGGIYLVCIIYSLIVGEKLLIKQDICPTLISLFILICTLTNLNNLAAASFKLRTRLTCFCLCLLGAGITLGVLPLICLVFKIACYFLGYKLLYTLEQVAPRIISMPERQ